MNNYKLHHFSNVEKLDLNRTYGKFASSAGKPHGLWITNEDDYGWKQWCKDNHFEYGRFETQFEIILKKDNKLLFITTPEEFNQFEKKHIKSKGIYAQVNWEPVFEKYHGIVIPHYFWQFRFRSNWYYTWDCASGCIWDLSSVEEARRV